MSEREAKMEEVLLWLDGFGAGGLGFRAHEMIKESLGLPNGKFCSRAKDCLKAGRCVRDPVCTE